MAKKLIHNLGGAGRLHCDVCNHDLNEELEFTSELIGHPCPRCGADMLTVADYKAVMKMFRIVDWLNKWFGWLGTETPPKDGYTMNIKVRAREVQ